MQVPQWTIEKKRDGAALTAEEIEDFIREYHLGTIPDYQMAAMAMAIYLKGMNFEETAHLTRSMMNTGECLDTSTLSRPVSDKHSTGGIGDKVSLILAPLAAACGLDVPMISGRGLGITGGTLDKLESIPGFRTDLNEEEVIQVVREVHCCIVGQTERLAPADKKLYALRDVTATVPSIPLITASIMCKKLSEGLGSLVLDVKVGKGAFMTTLEDARELATTMVRVGAEMRVPVAALITRMDQPLGTCIGNALEVQESIQILKGQTQGTLWDVTRELTATMLVLAGVESDHTDACTRVQDALDSGRALSVFKQMILAQGGKGDVCDHPERHLPISKNTTDVRAFESGYLHSVDAEAFGRAVLLLGGGRKKASDRIDPSVGISGLMSQGEAVKEGQILYTLHSNDDHSKEQALDLLNQAVKISSDPSKASSVLVERILP